MLNWVFVRFELPLWMQIMVKSASEFFVPEKKMSANIKPSIDLFCDQRLKLFEISKCGHQINKHSSQVLECWLSIIKICPPDWYELFSGTESSSNSFFLLKRFSSLTDVVNGYSPLQHFLEQEKPKIFFYIECFCMLLLRDDWNKQITKLFDICTISLSKPHVSSVLVRLFSKNDVLHFAFFFLGNCKHCE